MDIGNARNLTSHRAARSVWDKRGWRGVTIEERVGPWVVSLAGASLLVAGARRRSWGGIHLILGGVGLIGCAATGLCNPRHAAVRWRHMTQPSWDHLAVESMDSFPASDPPPSSAMAVNAASMCDL
jgi:hypothetical protein